MSIQLPPQIRNQLQKLAQKDAFLQSLDQFVRVGFQVLNGSGQGYTEQTCPTALLLAFSHCFCQNLPVSNLAYQLPQNARQQFIASCQKYSQENPIQFMQQNIQQLSDVEWAIDISLGRQIWNILLKFQSGKKLKILLNYQQLSVLVFKLGQIVAFVQNYHV